MNGLPKRRRLLFTNPKTAKPEPNKLNRRRRRGEQEGRLRQPLTERYRGRLAGVLSCYDRIIVTGTLPGLG